MAYDFKKKSKESEKYLKEILKSTIEGSNANMDLEEDNLLVEFNGVTPYTPVAPPPVPQEDPNHSDSGYVPKGQKCGQFKCKICSKRFKYIKPFTNHLMTHPQLQISQKPARGRPPKHKQAKPQIQFSTKPGRGRPPKQIRETSPDFSTEVANKLLSDEKSNDGESSRSRSRKQQWIKIHKKTPTTDTQSKARSSSPETLSNETPAKVLSRSLKEKWGKKANSETNDNPSKKARKRSPSPVSLDEESEEDNPIESDAADSDEGPDLSSALLEGFSEVDVNSVLKSKTFSFLDDDSSTSQSTPLRKRKRNRSRSSSVEVIPEFDIFGSPKAANPLATSQPVIQTVGGFICDQRNCKLKFHLKANLIKHQRLVHNK